MNDLEDDLEKELLNYNEMSSSIEKIKNLSAENKDLFRDLDTFTSVKNSNKNYKNYNNDNNNKNFDVNNFVQELENNLDNFDSVDKIIEPMASNQKFNKINEKIVNFEDNNSDDSVSSDDSNNSNDDKNYNKYLKNIYENWNNKIYDLLINIKEPIIIVLLFILLNNIDFLVLVNTFPFINNLDSPYPSLIIRGIILALIIYYLRKF